jgi:hypothetical protein
MDPFLGSRFTWFAREIVDMIASTKTNDHSAGDGRYRAERTSAHGHNQPDKSPCYRPTNAVGRVERRRARQERGRSDRERSSKSGNGGSTTPSMSFTHGLTFDESKPYLTLPPGKKLEHNGKTLALVDLAGGASQTYQ